MTLATLLAIGVALLLFGAYVLIWQPFAEGGLVRLPGGIEVRSGRAGFGIIALGVVVIVFATAKFGSTSSPTSEDNDTVQPGAIPFQDDFSTEEYGWRGGSYGDDVYHMRAVRGGGLTVAASPQNALTDANLNISVSAHRTEGTAQKGYGYGMFCRGDGQTSFYAFTIWKKSATLGKRVSGRLIPLADEYSGVQSPVRGESWKELGATCTTTTVNGEPAVELRFRVGDQLILSGVDPDTCEIDCGPPLVSGSFGLRALLTSKGEPGDTLEVTFDNFEVRED